jgi:hypothetical protein
MSSNDNHDSITTDKPRTFTCGLILWTFLLGVTQMSGGGVTPPSASGVTSATPSGVTSMSYRITIETPQKKPHELSLRQTAKQIVDKSWENPQWQCFRTIIWIESRWQPNAYNKHTTAYGLGQLIGSREYLSGKPIKQIHKTIEYISHRYPQGLACEALRHHKRFGWY